MKHVVPGGLSEEERLEVDLQNALEILGLERGLKSSDGYLPIAYDRKKYRYPWILEKDGQKYKFSHKDMMKKFKSMIRA